MEKECGTKVCYLMRDFNPNTSGEHLSFQPSQRKFISNAFYFTLAVRRVRRGCISDLDEETAAICSKYNEGFCKTCEGTNCNQFEPTQCKKCTNTYHENCVEKPEKVPSEECDHYFEDCVTIAVNREIITRTCHDLSAYQESCALEPWRCKICSTDNCNTNIRSDKFCYECNSATNQSCVSDVTDSMLVNCPLSGDKLGCYLHIDQTGS